MVDPHPLQRAREIDNIMEGLTALWRCVPELRLGQLICNVTLMADPFHISDAEMLKLIREYGSRVVREMDES
jgi:hypothetical protein